MALYLTAGEVAVRWGCSTSTVQRMCADGRLAAMRLGLNKWRIALAVVEAYERAHTAAGEASADQAPVTVCRPSRRADSPPPPAVDLDGEYVPIVRGPVPWRDSVIDDAATTPAAGRGRTARTKKAALSGN